MKGAADLRPLPVPDSGNAGTERDRLPRSVQMQPWDWSRVRSHPLPEFLPVREAVGRCQNPAGWNQTPPTAEHLLLGLAAPKYGGDPGVGLHRGHGPAHDLHLLPPDALPTCRLWQHCGWNIHLHSSEGLKHENDKFSQVVELPVAGSVVVGEARLDPARWDSFRNTRNTNY